MFHALADPARQLIAARVALRNSDWASSLRESIHAIEAMAVRRAPGADTLGAALKVLEQRGHLHGCLKPPFDLAQWAQRSGHGDDFLHTVRPTWRDANGGAFGVHAIVRLMEGHGYCPNGADIPRLRLRIDQQCEESRFTDRTPRRCQLPAFVYPPIIAIVPMDAPSRVL